MLRAIIVVFFIVVLAFAFVVLQFMPHRGARAAAPVGPAPLLETREDGSVYAVSLELDQLERRLMENEERSRRLNQDLAVAKKERDDLQSQVEDLQGEVDSLRRQMSQRPAPAPRPAPVTNAPAPVTPGPIGPTGPTTPGAPGPT
jgi:hypothetical protein